MSQPLVSVIVPTLNSADILHNCLRSIKSQTYENIEIIVVDNSSTDNTIGVARLYTDNAVSYGPERSAQRNYGVKISKGEYVLIIDSDMQLTPNVVASCVAAAHDASIAGVIVPEESFGEGFWAQCKKLERSFYIGIDWIEAARFFRKKSYELIGGYDETMVSGEDWDLSQRIAAIGNITRIDDLILHNEGNLRLFRTLHKKSYYAKKFTVYTSKTAEAQIAKRHSANPYVIVLKRFGLYFSRPHKLFRNPLLGMGMLFMKVAEFGYGAFGYLLPGGREG